MRRCIQIIGVGRIEPNRSKAVLPTKTNTPLPSGEGYFMDLRIGRTSIHEKGAPEFSGAPFSCGRRGIRTPGALQLNGFQDRRDRPLRHPSFRRTKVTWIFHLAKSSRLFVPTRPVRKAPPDMGSHGIIPRDNMTDKSGESRCNSEKEIRRVITILLHFTMVSCLINFFYDFC